MAVDEEPVPTVPHSRRGAGHPVSTLVRRLLERLVRDRTDGRNAGGPAEIERERGHPEDSGRPPALAGKSYATGRRFVDTNVLLSAASPSAEKTDKWRRARGLSARRRRGPTTSFCRTNHCTSVVPFKGIEYRHGRPRFL